MEQALEKLARAAGTGAPGRRRGAPAVQPRLAPRPRPAEHAAGQRVRGSGRAGAHRVARRPHPRGPSDDGPRLAPYQPAVPAHRSRRAGLAATGPRRAARSPSPARPPNPSAPTCSPSSRRRSWSSTSPKRSCTSEQLEPRTTAPASRCGGAMCEGGGLEDFKVEVNEGEVVLDIVHRLQATQAPDLAVRWNCKAGKCGSCSAEINGRPRLLCMTRMSVFDAGGDDHRDPAAGLPGGPGPGHGRRLQLRQGARGPRLRAAGGARPRRVPDDAGGRGPLAGVPQVHRVLPVPGHLPCGPRPRGEQAGLRRPALPDAGRGTGHAPAGRGRGVRPGPQDARPRTSTASATATSPSAAPRSAPRASRSRTTR